MWIQNVSKDDVVKAWHYHPGPNSMLISIVDHDMEHPPAKYPFKERFNFKFLDVEDEQEHAVTPKQINRIAEALIHAQHARCARTKAKSGRSEQRAQRRR